MSATISPQSRLGLLLGPFVLLAICWEGAARLTVVDPRFFPPPSAVLSLAAELYLNEGFHVHLLASLRRVILAGFLGGSSGIALGFLLGRSPTLKAVTDPHLSLLYPLPKIALLPVMFSIFGVTEMARILTMALAVLLLVTITTMGAVEQIEDSLVAAAIDNGAGRIDLYREVIFPGTVSQIASGLSLGLGVAVVLLVIIEMVAADAGLGYVIWTSWQLFQITELYVAIFSINVVGIVFVHGPEEIGTWITPWQHD